MPSFIEAIVDMHANDTTYEYVNCVDATWYAKIVDGELLQWSQGCTKNIRALSTEDQKGEWKKVTQKYKNVEYKQFNSWYADYSSLGKTYQVYDTKLNGWITCVNDHSWSPLKMTKEYSAWKIPIPESDSMPSPCFGPDK